MFMHTLMATGDGWLRVITCNRRPPATGSPCVLIGKKSLAGKSTTLNSPFKACCSVAVGLLPAVMTCQPQRQSPMGKKSAHPVSFCNCRARPVRKACKRADCRSAVQARAVFSTRDRHSQWLTDGAAMAAAMPVRHSTMHNSAKLCPACVCLGRPDCARAALSVGYRCGLFAVRDCSMLGGCMSAIIAWNG